MTAPPTRRIVLLGKTGGGKSSLGNTIFGETMFKINQLPVSQRSKCQVESKLVKGRNITLIDTPGFFSTNTSEEDMQPEIVQCIVESSPGPHAFVLVFKVEGVTDQEKEVISKMCQFFSEEALRYAVVLFTHGDQLPEGMEIQEFVSQNEGLTDLVKKCGGRCHVVDNKYWKSEAQSGYRSNQFQVEKLLNTIEKIVADNKGGHYTNDLLQAVETEMNEEEKRIRQEGKTCQEETREKTKSAVYKKNVAKFANIAGKGLMMALLGSEAALLISSATGVNTISPGEEKPPAGAAENAEATPGKKVLAALVKGGEMAKAAAGVISLATILGKSAPAEEKQGETLLGASTEVTVDGAAAAATEGIAEASAEGAVEMAAAAEGVAAAAEGAAKAAEGAAEGADAVATVMEAAEAAAEACCIQ